MILSMKKEQVTKGNYLFHEGEDANNMFIIIKGEFEVMKSIE